MDFLEKLHLQTSRTDLPNEDQSSEAEAEEESSVPTKRKRGRPRKYPLSPLGGESRPSEKKRGRPRKHFLARKETEETETEEKKREQHEYEKTQTEGELTIDVYETDEELVILSPVGGVKADELDIFLEDDMLVIRGERPFPQEVARNHVILEECYWGPFSRRFVLPSEVDGTKIQASLERGILTIRMPKIGKGKKKRIAVEETAEE